MAQGELDELATRLIAPLRVGDTLAGAELVSVTPDLALQYVFTAAGTTACIEVMPRQGARAERVLTTHFALGHRGGTMDPVAALTLCRAVAERIAANEHHVVTQLRASATADHGARVREIRGGRALIASVQGPPHYALSPYRGCTIGCRFCYAQSRLQPLRALLGLAAAPWGSWVDAHVEMPQRLAGELEHFDRAPIKFCPVVADPYQGVERQLRITRGCVEAIARCSRVWPTLVLTRAHEILDDVALWSTLPRAWVGVSLPTADDRVRRHFEPRAASVAERIDVLRRFAAVNVPTFAVVQPLLPGDVDTLADALGFATAGVALGTLEGEEQAGPLFDTAEFPAARSASWQDQQRARLRDALHARGVTVWTGEFPPGALA